MVRYNVAIACEPKLTFMAVATGLPIDVHN